MFSTPVGACCACLTECQCAAADPLRERRGPGVGHGQTRKRVWRILPTSELWLISPSSGQASGKRPCKSRWSVLACVRAVTRARLSPFAVRGGGPGGDSLQLGGAGNPHILVHTLPSRRFTFAVRPGDQEGAEQGLPNPRLCGANNLQTTCFLCLEDSEFEPRMLARELRTRELRSSRALWCGAGCTQGRVTL